MDIRGYTVYLILLDICVVFYIIFFCIDNLSADEKGSEDEGEPQSNVFGSDVTLQDAENSHCNEVVKCNQKENSIIKISEASIKSSSVLSKDSIICVKRGPGRPRKSTSKIREGVHNKKGSLDESGTSAEVVNSSLVDQETSTSENNRPALCSGNSVQTDFEVQCDLEPDEEEEPPQPTKSTVDVGIQVDPQELKQLASQRKAQFEKAEIGIQVQNEDSNDSVLVPVTQPLEIQVNFDEISDQEDSVNLLSEASGTSTKQLTPRRSSPRRHNPEIEVSNTDRTITSDLVSGQKLKSDLVEELEPEKKMLPNDTDLCQSGPKDKKANNSHKKKGKSSKTLRHSNRSSSTRNQSGASVDFLKIPKEKVSPTKNKIGKILAPKNVMGKEKSQKEFKSDVDHVNSCHKSGCTRSAKKAKAIEKELVEDVNMETGSEKGQGTSNREVSKPESNGDSSNSQELQSTCTKSKNPAQSKRKGSVEKNMSPDGVGEKFVESVTEAAKSGVISEISYEDFCKENEDDKPPESKSRQKSLKKKKKNGPIGKSSEPVEKEKHVTAPSKPAPLPPSKAQFQAAFESFISSSAIPANDRLEFKNAEEEEDRMESFFDGNEEIPFPAPETVDLTDGAEHTFRDEHSVPDSFQQNQDTFDQSPVKSKSKTRAKLSPKKKQNHISIKKVQNNDIAKDIEIIEPQTEMHNTQESSEEGLLNNVNTTVEVSDLEKRSSEVIVLSESDDEALEESGCPDCAKLQRACRGGRRKCRHRSGYVTKDLNKERNNCSNHSPHSANSQKSLSGADSDRECVVILERLDASQLPKNSDEPESGALESSQKTDQSTSTLSPEILSSKDSGGFEHDADECDTNEVAVISCDSANPTDSERSKIEDIQQSLQGMHNTDTNAGKSRNNCKAKKHKKFSSKFKSKYSKEASKKVDVATLPRGRSLSKNTSLLKRKEQIEPAVVHNVDDSDEESVVWRDTSPVICTIKRKNTNSEYEPLPVMKKKRKLQNDMGYSQPKRRRRRKSTVSSNSQLQSATSSCTAPLSIEIETIDLRCVHTELHSIYYGNIHCHLIVYWNIL